MTAELLASIAGIILSLLFSYVPGLAERFAFLAGTAKRAIMAGLLLAVALAAFGLSCANVLSTVICDQPGALGLVSAFISALIANQGAYLLSPETKSVRQARLQRWSQ